MSLSVCVCVTLCPEESFVKCRGVWHSRPTTRNEAVGESGKQGLISPVYLQVTTLYCSPLFLVFMVGLHAISLNRFPYAAFCHS